MRCQARPAGQLGGALGGERRGLLVPHVDDAHLLPHRRVVHREDVAAGSACGDHDRGRHAT